MDDIILLIDFGSTFTKVLAVDLDRGDVLCRAQSPSTVQENILIGLQNALNSLRLNNHPIDKQTIEKSRKLASSSAAGGLRLIAIGLVPELTLEAARQAALGAGGKVVGSFSYELNEDDIRQVEHLGCDLILLAGGTDGGDKKVILQNAEMLANSGLNIPFIVAGNKVVSNQVVNILELKGKYVKKTDNVLPSLDTLNVDPARACIRQVFINRIVHAKGLDKAQEFIGNILMPTPMATLKAAQLIADGTKKEAGLGELMVLEVGGATTNVHSVARGYSSENIVKGLPEPYAKRTVEGDLGIRYNAESIVNIVGEHKVLENCPGKIECTGVDLNGIGSFLIKNVNYIPDKKQDFYIDIGLARSAVEVAVERHAGVVKEVWTLNGAVKCQYGKDLTRLKLLIGTGGIFAYNPHAEEVLKAALFSQTNPFSLKPQNPDLYIDRNYILYGIGLLSDLEPDIALRIAKKSLTRLPACN
jgi:uncharacterized protein (TIGR01319 family)